MWPVHEHSFTHARARSAAVLESLVCGGGERTDSASGLVKSAACMEEEEEEGLAGQPSVQYRL